MKKANKKLVDIINNITERNLKITIIVCFFLCLVCEFVPDMIDICKLFNHCKIIEFLQPHKDFFTNIILGCLGSAVISYIVLHIQIKTTNKEKQENLHICLRKTVSKYWDLIFAIKNLHDIKNENKDLKTNIEEFLNYYKESDISNKYFEDFAEIFNSKLIPVVNEVEVFLNSFYMIVMEKEIIRLYNQEVYNKVIEEIYDNLYKLLYEEYKLNEVDLKFANIYFVNSSLIDKLGNSIENIQNNLNERNYAVNSIKYSKMIVELMDMENLIKIENQVSK